MYKVSNVSVTPRRRQKYQTNPGRTIIYLSPIGETILENLENRRRRPIKEWRKEVIPVILKQLGIDEAKTKVSFRQAAGCKCGCSPGWIVEGYLPSHLYSCAIHANVEIVD